MFLNIYITKLKMQNTLYQRDNMLSNAVDVRTRKADLKGEIHFLGQITGGLDFETEDGLFCEMAIDCGDGWDLLQPGANKGIQT
jgi:B9 domain-containing protein 2